MRPDHVGNLGLEESVINSISVCRYERGGLVFEGTQCSICLNEFHEDENLRLLPNSIHAFHPPCINTWLKSNVNCPLCRTNVSFNQMSPFSSNPPTSSFPSSSSSSNSQEQPQNHIGLERNPTNGFDHGNHSTVTMDVSVLEDSSSRRVNVLLPSIGELDRVEMVTDDIQLRQTSVSMDSSAPSMVPKEVSQLLQPVGIRQ